MTDHERGIEAACAEYWKSRWNIWREETKKSVRLSMERSVSAYLATTSPSKPVAEAVKVKPLDWREEPIPPAWESLASSCVGLYCIPHGGDRFYLRFRDSQVLGDFSTLAKAKDAAQADYEQRIMSALSTPPQPEAQALIQEQKKDG